MGVKVKVKRKGNFVQDVKKSRSKINKHVGVGFYDKEVLEYAPAHENGARIKITPRMRAFFLYMHSQYPDVWKPLSASKKYIIIPRRSVLKGFIKRKRKQKVIRKFAIDLINPSIIKGKNPNFDKYIESVVKENKSYYNTIKKPPKTELAEHQSGTSALLKSNRNSMYNALEGRVTDG